MKKYQLLIMLISMAAMPCTPLPQGNADQGYRLQTPVRVPSGIFSAPTVPPAPPTSPAPPPVSEVGQLYSIPQQRQQEQQQAAAEQAEVLQRIPNSSSRDAGPPSPPPSMEGMPYEFEWSVNDVESGLLYSHQESSDGTVAQGEYRVLLPDGRLQIVTFEDRGQGYQAQVTYQDYNP